MCEYMDVWLVCLLKVCGGDRIGREGIKGEVSTEVNSRISVAGCRIVTCKVQRETGLQFNLSVWVYCQFIMTWTLVDLH